MGGSSKQDQQIDNTIKASPVQHLANTKPMTMPQALPNQLAAIAAQLQAGYGGSTPEYLRHLDNTYDPVQTLKFGIPPAKPKDDPKPPKVIDKTKTERERDWRWTGGRNSR